jgi:hypothetical protein
MRRVAGFARIVDVAEVLAVIGILGLGRVCRNRVRRPSPTLWAASIGGYLFLALAVWYRYVTWR